jgi:hypothetical protein
MFSAAVERCCVLEEQLEQAHARCAELEAELAQLPDSSLTSNQHGVD